MTQPSKELKAAIAESAENTQSMNAAKAKIDPQAEIGELLASFRPPVEPKLSEAEKRRDERIEQIGLIAANLANKLALFADQTTDVEALAGALKSLQTVKYRAKRAIEGVPDAVLDPPAQDAAAPLHDVSGDFPTVA